MESNKFNNALLLYSIFNTQRNKNGSELIDIIAYSDYVSHSIMTFEEFKKGINYLQKKGLVNVINKRIFVDKNFVKWFKNEHKNNKRIYHLKAIEKIQKHLIKEEDKLFVDSLKKEFTKIEFNNFVKEYLKTYENIK